MYCNTKQYINDLLRKDDKGMSGKMPDMRDKRDLYRRYAGVCLFEDEYRILEDTGTIPKYLNQVFKVLMFLIVLVKENIKEM